MKKTEVKNLVLLSFLYGKMGKNHSAVNIAVRRHCPLFFMAVSENSPLNMLLSVKSRR
jgi:hypothetical protein